mmetsp:Transcript_12053/g.34450  ORF Transcript_12053/g.34450 Transcript_12053/m.34450 type:complete len:259 (-) Transcript_12053:1260-2036(-)
MPARCASAWISPTTFRAEAAMSASPIFMALPTSFPTFSVLTVSQVTWPPLIMSCNDVTHSATLALSTAVIAACKSFCTLSMVQAPFFRFMADSKRLILALSLFSCSSSGRIDNKRSKTFLASSTSSPWIHTCSVIFRHSYVSCSFFEDSALVRTSFNNTKASWTAAFSSAPASFSAASPKRWWASVEALASRICTVDFSSWFFLSCWSSASSHFRALRYRRAALFANLCTWSLTCASASFESPVDFRSVPKVSSCFRR